MTSKTLEKALLKWESKEHSVEEKLLSLQKAVYVHVGLKKDPDYYIENGKFLDRYVAGFISSFFWRIKDMSFILLDPLHIFDILTTFIKVLFAHPLKMLKQIWSTWTWTFAHGPFGLGMMTAGILLAFLTAVSATVLVKGVASSVVSASSVVPEGLMGELTYIPNKVSGMAGVAKSVPSYFSDLFSAIQKNPRAILAQVKRSVGSGVAYGRVREFKFYANPFLKDRFA